MTDGEVLVTYRTEAAMLVRASRAMTNRKWSTWALYAFGMLLIVGAVVHITGIIPGSEPLAAPWYAATFGAGVVIVASMWIAPYQMVQTLGKGHAAPGGPHEMRLRREGLEIRSPFATVTLQWAAIRQVWEDQDHLYFYLSDNYAQILPKAAIAPAVLEGIVESLDSWLGPDAVAKNRTLKKRRA